jgi:hypothetical protein
MATFNLNEKYSATYTVEKGGSGWETIGRLWKVGKDGMQVATDIRFRATGITLQAAIDAAHREARRVCPDD